MEKKQGFTLIEVVVVMIIISIVAGIAMITIHSNSRKHDETLAKQLTNTLLLAEQEAMLGPKTLGLAVTSQSFQFYQLERDAKTDENHWVPMNEPPFRAHRFPANTHVTLKIQDEIISANSEPKIIITPGNDLTPFVIFIGKMGESPTYLITGKANGEVTSAAFQAK
ncbi:MAG TPA: type II secretion system minor pseudopilin GspH [Gammaproteobacteria bacterium]|nr:type II secretion system minor pseudopilin GspH [Gammaproteobacteria bacterium]